MWLVTWATILDIDSADPTKKHIRKIHRKVILWSTENPEKACTKLREIPTWLWLLLSKTCIPFTGPLYEQGATVRELQLHRIKHFPHWNRMYRTTHHVFSRFHWHQIKSCFLVYGAYTEMQILISCQQNQWKNLMCYPVWCFDKYTLIKTLPSSWCRTRSRFFRMTPSVWHRSGLNIQTVSLFNKLTQ